MVFIQDIVRGTELTIASGGPPGGLPAATADPRQTPSPAARLAQARNKIGAPFWPAAHSASLLKQWWDKIGWVLLFPCVLLCDQVKFKWRIVEARNAEPLTAPPQGKE